MAVPPAPSHPLDRQGQVAAVERNGLFGKSIGLSQAAVELQVSFVLLLRLYLCRALYCCNQRTVRDRVRSYVSLDQWRRKVDIAILDSKFGIKSY